MERALAAPCASKLRNRTRTSANGTIRKSALPPRGSAFLIRADVEKLAGTGDFDPERFWPPIKRA